MIDRITVKPTIRFGKPCVTGTRIAVQDVLELLEEGLTFEVIRQDYYPILEEEDLKACVKYANALVSAEDVVLPIA